MGGSVVSGRPGASVERWWPHTHGPQPLYPLTLEVARSNCRSPSRIPVDRRHRTAAVSSCWSTACRSSAGVPCGCPRRGVARRCRGPGTRLGHLGARRQMNMLRSRHLGLRGRALLRRLRRTRDAGLQDCMVRTSTRRATRPSSVARARARPAVRRLAGPSMLAVVSGGSEVEQQAAMAGMERAEWSFDVLERVSRPPGAPTPDAVHSRRAPRVARCLSRPMSAWPTIRRGCLPAHLRRRSAEAACASPRSAWLSRSRPARRPSTKYWAARPPAATPPLEAACRVTRPLLDFEDVRDHYVADLFGADVMRTRTRNPSATRPRAGRGRKCMVAPSRSGGGGLALCGPLLLSLRDLRPGRGGGHRLAGPPKSGWFVLRRLFAPLTWFSRRGAQRAQRPRGERCAAPWAARSR